MLKVSCLKSSMSLEAYSQVLVRKVGDTFDIFDTEKNGTIDVREVGTVLRSLGVYPTEAQLHSMLLEIQQDEPSMYASKASFMAVVCRVISTNEITGPAPDELARAFAVLDPNNTGFLETEQLRVYLTTSGERLNADEMENFSAFATDTETGLVDWRSYLTAVTDILWQNDD